MVLVLWSINKLIKCEKKKNDCLFGWQKCSKYRIYSFSHAKWKFALLKSNFGYQCNQWKLDWLQILCFFSAHFCFHCIRIQSLLLCSFQWICVCAHNDNAHNLWSMHDDERKFYFVHITPEDRFCLNGGHYMNYRCCCNNIHLE